MVFLKYMRVSPVVITPGEGFNGDIAWPEKGYALSDIAYVALKRSNFENLIFKLSCCWKLVEDPDHLPL